ncbi:MAG TPA: response regulator [Roseiflexaceae bacterium]|nr:response regulator [Roseiflexaceae bacterium]
MVLSKWGCGGDVQRARGRPEITSAENGREAVGLLEEQNFDLMLVDLKMPEMDGMQVVEAAG